MALLLGLASLNAQNPCAPKMILMEQSCYKNCGPCYFHCRDEINPVYVANKNKIAMVVYSQEPIGVGTWTETNKPYGGFHDKFGVGYQSSVIMDRTFFPNNYDSQEGPVNEVAGNIQTAFNQLMAATYVPVSLNITNTYNASTRAVNISVKAQFCDTASGDMRIYLVLTQDTVKGPAGLNYAQNINTSASTIDGYNMVSYPSTPGKWAESFTFINAVKYQPSGFFGNSGIIPAHPVVGNTYTENFSFTLPVKNASTEQINIDPNRIIIIAAVVKNGSFKHRQVLNANKKYLLAGNTNNLTESAKPEAGFDAFLSNQNQLQLNFFSEKSGVGLINLYNAAGELIQTPITVEYSNNPETKTIDVSGLSAGIYFVSMKIGDVFYTRKIAITK